MPWPRFQLLDPNTRRRLARFGKIKRAMGALIVLIAIFVLSLFSEFIANDRPLMAKVNGKTYFPAFRFYPESEFTGGKVNTPPRYKELEKTDLFAPDSGNWMLWPPVRYGSQESLPPSQIEVDPTLTLTFSPSDQIASIDVDKTLTIQRSQGASGFYGENSDLALRRRPLISNGFSIPDSIRDGIARRFANETSPAVSSKTEQNISFQLTEHTAGSSAPKLVRLSVEQKAEQKAEKAVLSPEMEFIGHTPMIWEGLDESTRTTVLEAAKRAKEVIQPRLDLTTPKGRISVSFQRETVEFPFRPVKGHIFGLDNSGRDVGVRILYATRTALLFGFLLVTLTYTIGIFLGAVQGYFGGKIDLIGQRLMEIWEAMPFLLIMILLSSIYGRSFALLGFLYAIFNWIGISIYIRAEFLRLRKQPFVEAAKVMGIGRWKIMFRHVLPNGLVPVITFFPFALVGAIFMLTALDYLGFGLPPGTPSWGDLLDQGQSQSYAWWLTLYPSLALFLVSLLGIFIGEGIRAAFDPRTDSKLE